MNKQDFIIAMMKFAQDAWGGDAIPSDEKSLAEVFDYVIVELLKQPECNNAKIYSSG